MRVAGTNCECLALKVTCCVCQNVEVSFGDLCLHHWQLAKASLAGLNPEISGRETVGVTLDAAVALPLAVWVRFSAVGSSKRNCTLLNHWHPLASSLHPPPVSSASAVMASTPSTPNLPDPGQVLHLDFRPAPAPATAGPGLRLVQWNIERGYQLPLIIQQLQELDADIISLQEVQHQGRGQYSGMVTPALLSKALAVTCRYACRWIAAVSAAVVRTQGLPLHKR